ncbi:MAG: type IV secretory system conjugative DNA transfer family protein [Pseudomonadota bacterium]
MSVHRQTLEADHAARARERARAMEEAMRRATPSDALGHGRLATLADVDASGLFNNDGIFLGGLDGRLLFYRGDAPIMTIARTGAGKGRDLILPNLAHLRDRSLIVCDPKDGENAFVSAAHRRDTLGHKVVFLNPFGINGDQFPDTKINPFNLLVNIVRSGARIDSEASEIAHILIPRPVKSGGEEWVRSGALRLTATVLEYLAIFDSENCTPSRLWSFANSSGFDLGAQFAMMETCGVPSIEGRAASFNLVRADAPKQWEAYKSALADALEPFAPDGALANATSANEFDLRRLKREFVTVYLIVPSRKLAASASWIALQINNAIETIADERGPVRTSFILDEFAQLPPIEAVTKATRLYRSKGIQLWFFAQSRYSIRERYPEVLAREFEEQAGVVTMRAIGESDLIRDLELLSGNRTILNRGVSHNGGTVETAAANLGESKRSVLQAEDILSLGLAKQIIKVATMPHLIVSDCVPFLAVDPWKYQIGDVRALHRGEFE